MQNDAGMVGGILDGGPSEISLGAQILRLRFPTVTQRHAKDRGKQGGAGRGARRNARRACDDASGEATTRTTTLDSPGAQSANHIYSWILALLDGHYRRARADPGTTS